ncbi:AAA family ATPase [Sinimarinibacterium sp. CAU 1509]|uniref:AAA family ATPase n=1 Tax=Sinimarinibacterium sp. CAU 1509 TaxID=2562283 RepID=UPI0010ABF90F|nr:AAA family ATPase [Sinimarinibacterium sp. CAU 1509]TJY65030.1 AAA family ATPase [Sinimarinibacterium sp. CAU 1509]
MAKRIRFKVRQRNESLSETDVFVLTTDNWDDYTYKVQFNLAYIDSSGIENKIGEIKILQAKKGEKDIEHRTQLPEDIFQELGDNYISLGHESDYYQTLHSICGAEAPKVLVALRDIAWQPALAHPFETSSAFRNALMRFNVAHSNRRFGATLVVGKTPEDSPKFRYSGTILGAAGPTEAEFRFDPKDKVPGRVVAIIGRNAVGKTRYLARLGEDLAQIDRLSEESVKQRDSRFPDGRPIFTRVVAISYSAFDQFRRPAANPRSSYVYCGIRSDKGTLSQRVLIDVYKNNQERIREMDRDDDWTEYMQRILGDQSESLTALLDAEISPNTPSGGQLSLLSSGQAILSHFVTALLAWIQPNSLVLFDEPETHLHPNAVASLFMVMTAILKKYDSYAVVATHSPVVIQEVPAERVIVFTREGDVTSAESLSVESFGESVSELTRHVFETIEVESLYRDTLKKLAGNESAQEIMRRFPLGLSLNAQAYLLAYLRASEVNREADE